VPRPPLRAALGVIFNLVLKNIASSIIWNFVLAAIWSLSILFLIYNAIEMRIIDDTLSRCFGLSLLIFVLIQIIFLLTRLIKSLKSKQYIPSLIYIMLVVGLLLIGRMGVWITIIYFGGGAVGGH